MTTAPASTHPVVACARTLMTALEQVRDVQPVYMSTADKKTALSELAVAEAALTELRLRVMASSADVAAETGAKDAGAWVAHATRTDRRTAGADFLLAKALDARPVVARAMARGNVSIAQARVIVDAVADLPDRLGGQVKDDATRSLIAFAGDHGPKELRRLGRHILDVVAPEVADAEDAARLEALEQRARERASIRFRPDGPGRTRISAVVPTPVADRLALYLDAIASPRRPDAQSEQRDQPPSDRERIPLHRRRAWALQTLLENLDTTALPQQSGNATQVIVTITLDALRADLATAGLLALDDDAEISAGEARRLACTAGILPAVLGGEGQVLDAGRTRRLFTGIQRTLIKARYGTCVAEGCDVPVAWTQIHHLKPWANGGNTDLEDGVPACDHHHDLFHDPRYDWTLIADRVRFHRRE